MKNAIKLILTGAALLALAACTQQVADPVVPKAAVVKSFTASPSSVAAGEKATLSWTVQDATSVSIAALDGTPVPVPNPQVLEGKVEVTVEESTVYILTARGVGGSDTAASSVVAEGEAEGAILALSPAEITAGQSTTIIWNAPKATEVTITDAAGATIYSGSDASGSVDVTPHASTTYTLTAGDVVATAELRLLPAIFAFVAAPPAALPGEAVTLSWKAAGAESLTLSVEGRGTLATVTDPAQLADGSFQDTIPADLPASGVVNYTLIAKAGTLTAVQNLTVYVGVNPVITTFSAPTWAKAGGFFSVNWKTVNADAVRVEIDGEVVFMATSQAAVNTGAATLNTPAAATPVKIIATNARGGRSEQEALITPVGMPVLVSFVATPAGAIANGGEPVSITWEVTNARYAKLTTSDGKVLAEATGPSAETGSVQHYPNKLTTYKLVADNAVGDAIPQQTVTIDVTSPARLVFSPSTVPEGTIVQLTGSTTVGGGVMRPANFAVKNAPGTSFIDISATGTSLPVVADMDGTALVATFPAPFSTKVVGVPVTAASISVCVDGWMVFSDTPKTGYSSSFPTTAFEPLSIVPFSDDLETGNDTKIQWQIDGTGDQQRLIVQWTNIYEYPYTQSPTKKLTFQAQVYADGEVVVAFQDIVRYDSTDVGLVAMINANETGGVAVTSDQFVNGKHPAAGETYSFFGPLQLPIPVKAMATRTYAVTQQVGTSEIDVSGKPGILPPGEFTISEVNYNPVTGKEEWFEVQNNTSNAIDLGGWDIDFGGGNVHTIAGTVVLPANGRLLFGQSANSAEASSGGPSIDYVYGTGFSMPDAAGAVSISLYGGAYTTLSWTDAGIAGRSRQLSTLRPGMVLASTITGYYCSSTVAYGSGTQTGTPGAANGVCLPWDVQPSATAFQPISLAGGTVITGMSSTTNNGIDSVTKSLDFTALGGRPVRIGNGVYGNAAAPLSVSSNGWVSLVSTTSTSSGNLTLPTTSVPNGTLAVFWDDLAGNAGTTANPSGVYWKQFDPDGVPATGDEYTLISWENWKRYSSSTSGITSSLNFQLRIREATGDLEYVYGNMTASNTTYANGNDATIWLESNDGLVALKVLANQPLLQPNTSYRFVYTP